RAAPATSTKSTGCAWTPAGSRNCATPTRGSASASPSTARRCWPSGRRSEAGATATATAADPPQPRPKCRSEADGLGEADGGAAHVDLSGGHLEGLAAGSCRVAGLEVDDALAVQLGQVIVERPHAVEP